MWIIGIKYLWMKIFRIFVNLFPCKLMLECPLFIQYFIGIDRTPARWKPCSQCTTYVLSPWVNTHQPSFAAFTAATLLAYVATSFSHAWNLQLLLILLCKIAPALSGWMEIVCKQQFSMVLVHHRKIPINGSCYQVTSYQPICRLQYDQSKDCECVHACVCVSNQLFNFSTGCR